MIIGFYFDGDFKDNLMITKHGYISWQIQRLTYKFPIYLSYLDFYLRCISNFRMFNCISRKSLYETKTCHDMENTSNPQIPILLSYKSNILHNHRSELINQPTRSKKNHFLLFNLFSNRSHAFDLIPPHPL